VNRLIRANYDIPPIQIKIYSIKLYMPYQEKGIPTIPLGEAVYWGDGKKNYFSNLVKYK